MFLPSIAGVELPPLETPAFVWASLPLVNRRSHFPKLCGGAAPHFHRLKFSTSKLDVTG